MIGVLRFIAVALFLLAAWPALAQDTALIIAQQAYRSVPMVDNAIDDGQLVAAGLRNTPMTRKAIGNVDAATLRSEVAELAKRVPAGGGAFFYFRGHVVQAPARDRSEGMDNWLLGLDEPKPTVASLSLGDVLSLLNAAGVTRQVIVLDGATPIAGFPAGIAQPGARSLRQSVVVLNTSPSRAQGVPSGFASALAAELANSNLPAGELMLQVAGRVSATQAGLQRPLVAGSGASSRWVLNPKAAPAAPRPDAAPEPTVAMVTRYRAAIACGTQACLAAGANAVNGALRADLERRLAAITPVDDFDPGAAPATKPRAVLNPAQRAMIDALAIDERGKYQVGLWFLRGEATLPQDDELAFTWFTAAARPDADGPREAPVALWYRLKAGVVLGWFYHTGRGSAAKNPKVAVRYWGGGFGEPTDPDAMWYLADYAERCIESVMACNKATAAQLRSKATAMGVTRMRSPTDPDFPMKAP